MEPERAPDTTEASLLGLGEGEVVPVGGCDLAIGNAAVFGLVMVGIGDGM